MVVLWLLVSSLLVVCWWLVVGAYSLLCWMCRCDLSVWVGVAAYCVGGCRRGVGVGLV